MQPQQTPSKPVMDIAPPPKPTVSPAQPVTPAPALTTPVKTASADTAAGIPTKTAAAMPVKEAPHDPDQPESQPDAASEPVEASALGKKLLKPKPAGQSVTGVVIGTIVVMIALASLAIVVYLKS